MKAIDILKKPVLTEKAYDLQESRNTLTFVVDKKANKIEIKQAVEDFYNVKVERVNTLNVPAKAKSRFTKSGLLKGRKSGYKKAIVVLAEGESIDIFE